MQPVFMSFLPTVKLHVGKMFEHMLKNCLGEGSLTRKSENLNNKIQIESEVTFLCFTLHFIIYNSQSIFFSANWLIWGQKDVHF